MQNHLQGQKSPYLRQHAADPVDWYPWCPEALARAKAEDKPIFLSVGYSTCHWCHVMARESFSDPEIARALNRDFVAIKVDREERPDVDSVYMAAVQAFTGRGGWPMSLFLTPAGEPFFAGTYFPPRAQRGGAGFLELVQAVATQWREDRPGLLQAGKNAAQHLRRQASALVRPAEADLAELALSRLAADFDPQNGGFGLPPKFPSPHNLLFLLDQAGRDESGRALAMAEITLERMYRGGIYDQIGYGFCRYSTDARWLVPHFEKMLYDNALLLAAYTAAYARTGEALYLRAAEETADYVRRELTGPEGGFFSAQDADSQGEEGLFYLLTPAEVTEALGETTGRDFCARYDITAAGNFEGKSIPNRLDGGPLAPEDPEALTALRDFRKRRASLHLDDKCLTAWNSMYLWALCRLYRASGRRAYWETARRGADFLTRRLTRPDGGLYVAWREAPAGPGFLDDYAWAALAHLELYRAGLRQEDLDRALALGKKAVEDFFDSENGGFYLSGAENETLLFRPKETFDGAVPSGNAVMYHVLARLCLLTEDTMLAAVLDRQEVWLEQEAAQYPAGFCFFLLGRERRRAGRKITVVPAPGEDLEALALVLPGEAEILVRQEGDSFRRLEGETTFYDCGPLGCSPPTTEPPRG